MGSTMKDKSIQMIDTMAKAYSYGLKARNMKECIKMVLGMVLEFTLCTFKS